MTPRFTNAMLFAIAALAAGCGGGTEGDIEDRGPALPPPSNGVTGIALKGVIGGGAVTISNASGGEIALAAGGTTQERGRYSITFAESAVAAGITAPLTVTVTGGNTVCDLDIADTTEDCAVDDDVFVAFGESYPLPAEFTMRATTDKVPEDTRFEDPVVTINVSPASDIATSLAETLASGAALTSEEVATANGLILGLIERLTGVEMGNASLTGERLFDLATLDATTDDAPDASYALLAFAAATLAELDPNDTDVDTLLEVMNRIKSELSINEAGNLVATGTTLSRLAESMLAGLDTVNLQLEARGAARQSLQNAASVAQANIGTFAILGDEEVEIAAADAEASSEPLALTRQFVKGAPGFEGGITAPPSGIVAGPVLTNGTVSLSLTAPQGHTRGVFTVGVGEAAVRTAILDDQGVVHYLDGSFETLPRPPVEP